MAGSPAARSEGRAFTNMERMSAGNCNGRSVARARLDNRLGLVHRRADACEEFGGRFVAWVMRDQLAAERFREDRLV